MRVMSHSFEIWKVLAGIAIFLLGMNFLEDALRLLTGRKFKLFLRRQTDNKLTAIGGGALVTGVLQSSSVVNLMVLALVGAGTLKMQNALAVILGANIGTTLTTWVVATIGFEISVDQIAFPAVAIAGITRMVFRNKPLIYDWGTFFLGLGFLFVGLDFMKTGMEDSLKTIDLSVFQQYPVFIFLLVGLMITSLIQSSSATAAIALSALYAGAINLYMATAIVLGSEIGTTLKLLLAAYGGEPVKKRVALGNFLYNMTGTIIIFILLKPVNLLITDVVGIPNPLIALAFFQTFINVVSIILFYPFLNVFGKFLERRFVSEKTVTSFIGKVPASDVDLALMAMEKETKYFLQCVIRFSADAFHLNDLKSFQDSLPRDFLQKDVRAKYEFLKILHGDIYAYYIALQNKTQKPDHTLQLDMFISSVRNGMYAAKSIKDALKDMEQLSNSGNEIKYRIYEESRRKAEDLLSVFISFMETDPGTASAEEMMKIYKLVQEGYTDSIRGLYQEEKASRLSEIEISTIINFNREIYTAFKSLVFGIKGAYLSPEEAEYLKDLPGFIR
jgi:phosphate:Na+ symporter